MWFDSIEAVREFASDDYEKGVVTPAARTLLSRFDERSTGLNSPAKEYPWKQNLHGRGRLLPSSRVYG